ncbi:amidohydrolase family protein [Streptomyces sp. NEAU-H3]|uniref:amidohydrolase family protein n=1 Tax=Streptomyces sp. NEAU-H3 TaxID=2720636 RepID=UPI00280B742B|nr:amidohydrolase family protein [Streptomyces sp. NEAU-H3]
MSATERTEGAGNEPVPPLPGVLDAHAHYVTPALRAALEAAGHGRPDGMPAIPDWSPEEALALMDRTGVAAALLSVSSPGVHFGDDAAARALARRVNEEGAALVAAHPGRFGLLASLPLPDLAGAREEARYALDALGADGIALQTQYGGRHIGDAAFEPLLGDLSARGAVVVLHPTSPACFEAVADGFPRPMLEFPFETARAVAGLVLGGALDRHPGIRFVVPPAGGALPVLADRIAAFALASGNDVDVYGHLRRLYYDLAGFPLPRQLPALLTLTDEEHVLYGSDFPFTPGWVVEGMAATLARGVGFARGDGVFRRFAGA